MSTFNKINLLIYFSITKIVLITFITLQWMLYSYNSIIFQLILVLILFIPLLIAVALFTYIERKILGFMQRRKGPNVVGFFGLLQPIADGFKLLLKESLLPITANRFLFILAPILAFFLSLMNWLIIPYTNSNILVNINLGVFYLFVLSTLAVYSIISAGWSSNSKYPLLGALRAAAQMISYEVSFGVVILIILTIVGSLNLKKIIIFQDNLWFILPFLPFFFMFFISVLAETNRPPFDLPEAEAELVSGYNVEYSSMTFACFFLAEYANMILMSILTVILFFGGWLPYYDNIIGLCFICVKTSLFIFLFVWVRAAFPRLRYDQLMFLGWKVFLPLSLGVLLLYSSYFFMYKELFVTTITLL